MLFSRFYRLNNFLKKRKPLILLRLRPDCAPIYVVRLPTARGIRSLLELLGLRVCAATGSTGDDDGVQRATHHLLYGPQV
jgi:hypothetical protein